MTLQKVLALSKHHVEILKKHARQNEPNESCAILLGKTEDAQTIITEVFLTRNQAGSPLKFTISNNELIEAYQESEKRGLEVAAIFHSHPTSAAYPSSTDLQYMDVNPIPWIIYSNSGDEFCAYILESAIVPLKVRII